jgi:ferritin-like metal-binding protein YciE
MGLFSKDIKTINDLFLYTLQDIYYAEKKILKSLPGMINHATNSKPKFGLDKHRHETENHVARLEKAFRLLDQTPTSVDCPAIDGILKEAKDIIGETADKRVVDAAIVAAAQAVEHYEITRYGSLIAWAIELERPDISGLLRETLKEEEAADRALTSIATSELNRQAAMVRSPA